MRTPAISAIALLFMLVSAGAPAARAAVDFPLNLRMDYYDADLVRLDWEIKTLNLINGLYLTPDQMRDMLGVLERLQDLDAGYQEDMTGARETLKRAYTALRDDLLDDDLVDPDVERRAGAAKQHAEDLVRDYAAQQKILESDVLAVLTDKQKSIADSFVPCIIPPKSANNSRIGQMSGSNPQMEEMLVRLRNLSEAEFQQLLPQFIARRLENYEAKHGLMSARDKDAEFDRLYSLARSVRDMSDVEFELKKSELAAQITPAPDKAKDKPEKQNQPPKKGPQKKYALSTAGSLLLNVNIIPILEEKLGG